MRAPIRMAATILLLGITTGASAAQQVFIAFGDSITAGVPYRQSAGNGCRPTQCNAGYEPPLEIKLRAGGADKVVQNQGVPGECTFPGCPYDNPGPGGVNRIDTVLDNANPSPKYVLLMEGTNDLLGASPKSVRDGLSIMIDKIRAHNGVVPILATITPDERFGKPVPQANDLIRQLAVDKNVTLCDQYDAVHPNWNNLVSGDNLHPNTAGYEVIGDTWFKCIPHGGNIMPWLDLLLDDN